MRMSIDDLAIISLMCFATLGLCIVAMRNMINSKTLKFNSIILRNLKLADLEGNIRGEFYMDNKRPVFALYDKNQKPRMGLVVDEKGAGLVFFDENDRLRAELGVGRDPALTFFGNSGERRVDLRIEYQWPRLVLCDEHERPLIGIGLDEEGAKFRIDDGQGNILFSKP